VTKALFARILQVMRPPPTHHLTSPAVANSATHDFASCVLGAPRAPHIMRGDWQTPASRQLPEMRDEIHRAVTALHEGRPVIVGTYQTGVYREIVALESLRDSTGAPKGLLAVATRYNGGKEQTFLGLPTLTLVYLPTPEDAAAYYLAGALSYRAGPADLYPGSVGSLELVHDPMSGIAQITQLQSSAKVSEPAVSDILKKPGNSLCTKYQKWSSRLLERAFEHVRRLGISQIAVGPQSETDLPLSAPVRNLSMIRNKAEACGFTLSSDRSLLIDTRSPR
jgi:hypothetical protein